MFSINILPAFILFLTINMMIKTSSATVITLDRVYVSELFSTKIEPKMFNWTFGQPEQFQYRASLKGYPDLPSWMRYMYSNEYYAGYLYGTPPLQIGGRELQIDIVGLNRQNYETKRITLSLMISTRKSFNTVNTVHMKIDNLNWVHLMDPGRVENLKNIFRNDLWNESSKDLHIVFMESAIKMGGRIPLRPQQNEGVIIYLGSIAPFSSRLVELQEEIRPLYRIASCSYKRTSVQTIFENAGFKMDWCAFRIIGTNGTVDVNGGSGGGVGNGGNSEGSESNKIGAEKSVLEQTTNRWEPMARDEVPKRNYIDELAFAIAIPGMLLAAFVGILSAVLCLYHDKVKIDELSELYFANIFHICTDYSERYSNKPAAAVQMVQYSMDTNQPVTTTLKSLKDPNHQHLLNDTDQNSVRSQSPSNLSVNRPENIDIIGSPRLLTAAGSSSTLRPRPPPYKPPTVFIGSSLTLNHHHLHHLNKNNDDI